ncbi:MAG TPA: hypothetical protein VG186_03650 [Solirubrobacteraceae bacterium]|jgi:hypothetical protein|nr:hypothetical protein [Solirubrobacteraceae bacterium]
MNSTITYLTAREHISDLAEEARISRQARPTRDRAEVRRVAVVWSAGSHFRVLPVRALSHSRTH